MDRAGRVATAAALAAFTSFGAWGCKSATQQAPPPASESVSVDSLRRRVEADPKDVDALARLGRELVASNPAEAARFLRQAISLDPAGDAWKDLADLYASKGYLDRLLEVCEQHLKAKPDDIDAMVRLAPFLVDVGDRKGALALVERARALAPDRPDVIETATDMEYTAVRFRQAVEAYTPLVQGKEVTADRWNRYSELLRADGRYDEAAAAIRKAIAMEPGDGSHHRQLAHILATREPAAAFADAEVAARKAIELGDNSLDARYWLAVALEGQPSKRDAAVVALENVAKEDVSYEQAAFKLGRLLLRSGRADEGKKLLKLHDTMSQNEREMRRVRRALRERPDQLANHYAFATLSMRSDDTGMAIAVLRRASERFPDNRAVREALAKALDTAGRRTEARVVREKSASTPDKP